MPRRAPCALHLAAALLLAPALIATPTHATTIPAGVEDRTDQSAVTVTFPGSGFAYTPKLVAIGRPGADPAQVTWSGSFTSHPLRFENLAIPGQSSGSSETRPFKSGHYAYYCSIHGNTFGMKGEVWVAGPKAKLQAKPEDVAPGGQTTLDAGDTDLVSFGGANATYEFDPEGDGTFLPPTAANAIQATYPTAGTYAAHVRVTDDAGRVDEASNWVYVAVPLPPPPPVNPPPSGGDPGTPGTAPGTSQPKPKGAALSDLATLPSRKRCLNRRRGLRVVVKDSQAADVRYARVRINGRPAKRLAVGRRREIIVRGLRGRPDVSVTLWLADGSLLNKTYRYRVCAG